MYKVTFKFENSEDITVFAAFGENLLEVARKTNVAIDAPCNGNAACGKCRVKLVKGELESERTRHISQEEYDQGGGFPVSVKLPEMWKFGAGYRLCVPKQDESCGPGFSRGDTYL